MPLLNGSKTFKCLSIMNDPTCMLIHVYKYVVFITTSLNHPSGAPDFTTGYNNIRFVVVRDMFNSAPRRIRRHSHRHYKYHILHDVSLNDLLPFIQKPLGIQHTPNYFHYPF
jgi:hypothetical protein